MRKSAYEEGKAELLQTMYDVGDELGKFVEEAAQEKRTGVRCKLR